MKEVIHLKLICLLNYTIWLEAKTYIYIKCCILQFCLQEWHEKCIIQIVQYHPSYPDFSGHYSYPDDRAYPHWKKKIIWRAMIIITFATYRDIRPCLLYCAFIHKIIIRKSNGKEWTAHSLSTFSGYTETFYILHKGCIKSKTYSFLWDGLLPMLGYLLLCTVILAVQCNWTSFTITACVLLVFGFIIYKWNHTETSLKHSQMFRPCHMVFYDDRVVIHMTWGSAEHTIHRSSLHTGWHQRLGMFQTSFWVINSFI